MGTVNVLECVRESTSVQAAVIVTSDKCYKNVGRAAGYHEGDALGGHDPYSSSKACAELVTNSYRNSFFCAGAVPAIASARAGNAIGGGDWAQDRLVPDAVRAFLHKVPLKVRQPQAVRPWQHVLDPVLGYLILAERLSTQGKDFAEEWNFGPGAGSEVSVADICERLAQSWGEGATWTASTGDHAVEAQLLKLDCSKAAALLNWQPLVNLDRAIVLTMEWYKGLQQGSDMRRLTLAQIDDVLASFWNAEAAA
jgi:CDP-glucose 4,6-dehydratase